MTVIAMHRMRAAVFYGGRDIRIEAVPVPTVAEGELLLRVEAVGVCGTDAAEWAHGPLMFPITSRHRVSGHQGPMIPGHEFSGTVVAVGADVDPSWIGKLVASCGAISCGTCRACKSGRSNQCPTYHTVGLHRNGALAEYVAAPVESCLAVDGLGISADEAALAQPMAIAVHATRRSGVEPGDVVLVQGVGGIGAFLVHVLTQAGATVIAADRDESRLAVAADLGATTSCVVDGTDDASALRGAGADDCSVIFEVSGSASGLATALEVLPGGATLVLVGIQERPSQISLRPVTLREQTLVGTNALVRETDFPKALELLAVRRGRWSAIAPKALPLEDLVAGALAPMSEGKPPSIKTLVDPAASLERATL